VALFDLFRHFRDPRHPPNPLFTPRPTPKPCSILRICSLVSARIRLPARVILPARIEPTRNGFVLALFLELILCFQHVLGFVPSKKSADPLFSTSSRLCSFPKEALILCFQYVLGFVPSKKRPGIRKCIDLLTSSQGSPFLPAMLLEPVESRALPLPLIQLSRLVFKQYSGVASPFISPRPLFSIT